MRTTHRKRWTLLGGVFGAGIAAVVVSAVAVFAGSGLAASQAKPANTVPPTISGTPQEGKTLHGDKGKWTNNPTDYNYWWQRCDKKGGNCANISGAHATDYTLTSADVNNTIRFKVEAKNADGQLVRLLRPDRGRHPGPARSLRRRRRRRRPPVARAAPAPHPSARSRCPHA